MTDDRIDYLLAQRNKLLQRRDGLYDSKRIDAIDAKLATVPTGTRNDVDLALGRINATPPARPDYGKRVVMVQHADGETEVEPGWIVNPVVTLEHPDTISALEQIRILHDSEQNWQHIKGDLAL